MYPTTLVIGCNFDIIRLYFWRAIHTQTCLAVNLTIHNIHIDVEMILI